MPVGYKPLKDQIVAVLQTVSEINVVYGKEEKSLAQFPAACVSAKEHRSRYNSVGQGGSNEREYQHYVRVYFRIDENNDADYEDVLEDVADKVVQAFESNVTLNSACKYSIPVSGVWRYGEKESPVRVFELVIASTLLVQRDTGIAV